VLNIGYNIAVFSPAPFTMLVVALVRTTCTSLLLNLSEIQNDGPQRKRIEDKAHPPALHT